MDNVKKIGTDCVHVSTEVLEELTRCDPCNTHCIRQWQQVFLSAAVVARPYCMLKFVNGRVKRIFVKRIWDFYGIRIRVL